MTVLSLLLALPVLAQPSIFLEVINNTTTWPKIWASDGMPSTPAVPSPAMAGLAVPNPGQVDAIRLPSGKALVFGIRQHNTLSVLEVTGTLPVVTFKICATIQLSLPYRVTRATLASPDGKMLYVMAGHYLPAGGPPQNDVMWTIPILDCMTKCLDDTVVKMYTIPTKDDLGSMAFDPGGKWIAAAGVTNNIEILDAANPSNVLCTVPLPPKGAQARGRNIVAVSPNTSGGDRAVYVGSYEGKSLSVIRVTPSNTCSLAATVDPPFYSSVLYGPGGGVFHPTKPNFYWMAGNTLGSVLVVDTTNLFNPVLGVSKPVTASFAGSLPWARTGTIDPVKNKLYVAGPSMQATPHAGLAVFDIAGANAANPVPQPYIPVQDTAKTGTSGYFDPAIAVYARPVTGVPNCPGQNGTVTVTYSVPAFPACARTMQGTIDGAAVAFPQTLTTWAPGSNHTIAATDIAPFGPGMRYKFVKWSDNVTSRTRTVGSGSATYTAEYRIEYELKTDSKPGWNFGAPPSNAGWHAQGNTVTVSAAGSANFRKLLEEGTTTQTTATTMSVKMDSPKKVVAYYQTTGGRPNVIAELVGESSAGLPNTPRCFTIRLFNYGDAPASNVTITTMTPTVNGVTVSSPTLAFNTQNRPPAGDIPPFGSKNIQVCLQGAQKNAAMTVDYGLTHTSRHSVNGSIELGVAPGMTQLPCYAQGTVGFDTGLVKVP